MDFKRIELTDALYKTLDYSRLCAPSWDPCTRFDPLHEKFCLKYWDKNQPIPPICVHCKGELARYNTDEYEDGHDVFCLNCLRVVSSYWDSGEEEEDDPDEDAEEEELA